MSMTEERPFLSGEHQQLNSVSADENVKTGGDIIPSVSVIMPNFNCEKFIYDAVDSVLTQTFTDLELIVVDDCSTDKSVEIVENIARKDGRIVLLKNTENKGAAFCRNRGVKAARGRYIAFLDSDDLWTADKLEKQLAFMKEGGYAFSCTSYDHIDEDGKPLNKYVTAPKVIDRKKMLRFCYVGCLTAVYDSEKTGVVQIDERIGNGRNDYAMWLKISKDTNLKCYYFDEILAHYRVRHNSLSHSGLGKIGLIKLHYELMRYGEDRNPLVSFYYMFKHTFWGVIKKLRYVKKLKPLKDERSKEGEVSEKKDKKAPGKNDKPSQYTFKSALNYVKARDVLSVFAAMIVFLPAIICKLFLRNVWLVSEYKNEARDNGYHFFRYMRENYPKRRVYYAINKKCKDYGKVKGLGKIISYGTLSHWFWYIVADKNISSQKGGKPNAAACYLFEVILKMRKNNRVFLQHGITINNVDCFNYKNTGMRLFITGAAPETEYIKQNFGYPEDGVKMTGFARFDSLHDGKREEDLVLVMPSWREWIGRESKDNKNQIFTDTPYYKCWNGFLNSEELHNTLEKYNCRLIFYPHRNMQKFLCDFNVEGTDRITFASEENYDVQDLLKRAAVLITDYSSVFFDFSYMRKPVVFYQFDYKEFRERHYEEGYFDYGNTVLGKRVETERELNAALEKIIGEKAPLLSEETVKEFFPLYDTNNCKRIFEAIDGIGKKAVSGKSEVKRA